MKTLRRGIGDYLALRRSLGFKLRKHEPCLREFISFLKTKRTSRITTQLALQFATHHRHHQPAEWAARLSVVRGFACYRSGDDLATEIPPPGLLPCRPMRARPYLYSEEEIGQLLKAAKSLRSTHSLRCWTYYCLLGLLAVTGVRISEALNLQPKDVDWSEGLLTIRGVKFGKSRLVPLHPSTEKVLSAYAKRRDRFFAGKPVSYFFVSSRGNRLDGGDVRRTFYTLSRQTGLRKPFASRGPRLHDFATALPFKRWCVGITAVKKSNGACPSYRPISVTHMSPTLTGTSPTHRSCAGRRESDWTSDGEVGHEPLPRLPHLARVIFHSTSHRSTKGEPSYDCFVSGYLSFAVVFRSETIAQATLATCAERPKCPIPRSILKWLGDRPRQ
jgi:integrase/recombinase XerD